MAVDKSIKKASKGVSLLNKVELIVGLGKMCEKIVKYKMLLHWQQLVLALLFK